MILSVGPAFYGTLIATGVMYIAICFFANRFVLDRLELGEPAPAGHGQVDTLRNAVDAMRTAGHAGIVAGFLIVGGELYAGLAGLTVTPTMVIFVVFSALPIPFLLRFIYQLSVHQKAIQPPN